MSERQKSVLLLAALWLLLLFLAATRPLAVPDEGRYGEIGRWMLQSGDWLTPRLNGVPFFHKPPLVYWLEATFLAVFGVNVLALRLTSILHVGLLMLLLHLAVARLSTEQLARRTSLMLGTSLTFLVGGQYVNHDMAVAVWISVAIGCFAFAFMAGAKPHATLARCGFVACALGVLSKGLIGFVLPGLVLFIWLIATKQLQKIRSLPWVSGLALFAVVCLPWFVLVQQKYPGFFDYMFVNHQVTRFTAATFNNPQPLWFFPLAWVVLLFPWVFFAFAPLWRRPASSAQSDQAAPLPRAWVRLCWIWVLAITVFFSIPNSKLVGYILPVMPPLAVLGALGWQRLMAGRAGASRWFAGLCAVNLVGAVVLLSQAMAITQGKRAEDVALVFACAATPSDTVYVTGGYPYEFPFYAQTTKPLQVVADWPTLRQQAADSWARELFEGADFDAEAAQVLQSPDVLATAARLPGQWLLTRKGSSVDAAWGNWELYFEGTGWRLYRSAGVAPSTPEGPVATEHKGLPGCQNQRAS